MILSITGNGISLVREVDLAGNQIRQMTIGQLQQKMQAPDTTSSLADFTTTYSRFRTVI